MRHEGGLPEIHKIISVKDMQPSNISQNSLGKIIEVQPASYPADKLIKR